MIQSKILGAAPGIQYQGNKDLSETSSPATLTNGLIVGNFRRGFTGAPFTVTDSNYQALLGFDPNNPDYMAVQDAFALGIPALQVMRVGGVTKAGVGNAHIFMFGYDYSNQMDYALDENGNFNEELRQYDLVNYINTIHQPQLKLTINDEVCPYSWDEAGYFMGWLREKTLNSVAVSSYDGDLSKFQQQLDIAELMGKYPNFAPMLSFNNLSGKDLKVEIEFRENHYYRVYTDDMTTLTKASNTKYQTVLKPYNPLPTVEPPQGGTEYVTMSVDIAQDQYATVYGTAPFVYDLGDGVENTATEIMPNIYSTANNQDTLMKLEASKQLKVRPIVGTSFGTMIIMASVLDWGGIKFDASLSDPALAASMLQMMGINETNVALAFKGDYSKAGEPTIVNGVFVRF